MQPGSPPPPRRPRRITLLQLLQGRAEQRLDGADLAVALVDLGHLAPGEIPEVPLEAYEFEPEALALVDRADAAKHRMIPLYRGRAGVVVAMVDPLDFAGRHLIRSWTWTSVIVEAVYATEASIAGAFERAFATVTPRWPAPPDDGAIESAVIAAVQKSGADETLRRGTCRDVEETLRSSGHPQHHRAAGRVACALCGRYPSDHRFVNATPGGATASGRAPVAFVAANGPDETREPALCRLERRNESLGRRLSKWVRNVAWLCHACLEMDWHARARHLAFAVKQLAQEDDARSRAARTELVWRFSRQAVHGVGSGECMLCGARGPAIRGRRVTLCDACARAAATVGRRHVEEDVAGFRAQREEVLRRKRAIRIPEAMRVAARSRAGEAAERRAAATGAPFPAPIPAGVASSEETRFDALGLQLRAADPEETLYAWLERSAEDTTSAREVDAVAERLAVLLEEIALAGLQRIDNTRGSSELDVLVRRWPATCVARFLARHRPSTEARRHLDESIALVEQVIATGVHYLAYNGSTDFDCIDRIDEDYLALARFLS